MLIGLFRFCVLKQNLFVSTGMLGAGFSRIIMGTQTTESSMNRSKPETQRGLLLHSSFLFSRSSNYSMLRSVVSLRLLSRRSVTLFIFCSFTLLTYCSFGIVFVSSCTHAIVRTTRLEGFLSETVNPPASTAHCKGNEHV